MTIRIVRSGGIAGRTTYDTGVVLVSPTLHNASKLGDHFFSLPERDPKAPVIYDGFNVTITVSYSDGTSHTIERDENSPDISALLSDFMAMSTRICAVFLEK